MRRLKELEIRIANLELEENVRIAHTMSKKDRARLDELQELEDQDRLTSKQNKEYEALVEEYRRTDEFKKQKRASMSVRESSAVVKKSLNDFQKSLDQMEKSLMSMPSFTSNDRYYANIADRWRTLRKNINTIKEEIDFIKGAY